MSFPKPAKGTKKREKARKVRKRSQDQAACYRAVDARDRGICRAYGTRATEHHHLVYRSKGGRHETANVVSLSWEAHQAVHAKKLFIAGNADETLHFRNQQGKQWISLPLGDASHAVPIRVP